MLEGTGTVPGTGTGTGTGTGSDVGTCTGAGIGVAWHMIIAALVAHAQRGLIMITWESSESSATSEGGGLQRTVIHNSNTKVGLKV